MSHLNCIELQRYNIELRGWIFELSQSWSNHLPRIRAAAPSRDGNEESSRRDGRLGALQAVKVVESCRQANAIFACPALRPFSETWQTEGHRRHFSSGCCSRGILVFHSERFVRSSNETTQRDIVNTLTVNSVVIANDNRNDDRLRCANDRNRCVRIATMIQRADRNLAACWRSLFQRNSSAWNLERLYAGALYVVANDW